MKKIITTIVITIMFCLVGQQAIFAAEKTDVEFNYEQAYNDLVEKLNHTPNFIYTNGILSANEKFIINSFGHSFQASYNEATARYEVDLLHCYNLFYDVPTGEIYDTIHSFTWNGIIVNIKMYNLGKIFLYKIVHFYLVLFVQFYFALLKSLRYIR